MDEGDLPSVIRGITALAIGILLLLFSLLLIARKRRKKALARGTA
ncbi:MAG: LPXTG cell wall anchor domain-containing protein [Vicinamibacteria bacterium]|nr:LPXTG cell wall anchor domain-containing protein [Vicinamibacteria bacterium]